MEEAIGNDFFSSIERLYLIRKTYRWPLKRRPQRKQPQAQTPQDQCLTPYPLAKPASNFRLFSIPLRCVIPYPFEIRIGTIAV